MSVYKEGYQAVQAIQTASMQIYPDACDFGAPDKKKGFIWNAVKQAVEWYGLKETRVENSCGVEIYISLMDEWKASDDENKNADYTEFFKISYVKVPKLKGYYDGFFMVEKVEDKKKFYELKLIEEKKFAA